MRKRQSHRHGDEQERHDLQGHEHDVGLHHHFTRSSSPPNSGAEALSTVGRLVDAHNRGDAGAFAALYHADARHSHARRDRTRLGGGIAKPASTPEQRRRFYRELYAKKPPTPVEIVGTVALGEWAATRERYFEPDGSRRDHLTIYRVSDGLIVDDWHLAP